VEGLDQGYSQGNKVGSVFGSDGLYELRFLLIVITSIPQRLTAKGTKGAKAGEADSLHVEIVKVS
jgi:hypothetical protein